MEFQALYECFQEIQIILQNILSVDFLSKDVVSDFFTKEDTLLQQARERMPTLENPFLEQTGRAKLSQIIEAILKQHELLNEQLVKRMGDIRERKRMLDLTLLRLKQLKYCCGTATLPKLLDRPT